MAGPAWELPWYLTRAIALAVNVDDWQSNLGSEDVPPRRIWHHQRRLTSWFKEVRERLRNPDRERGEPVPDPDMMTLDNGDLIAQMRGD